MDASRWTLDSDKQLLLKLEEFSNQFVADAKLVEDRIHHLNTNVGQAKVAINNVFNRFIILANDQFIENVRFHGLQRLICVVEGL